MSLWWRRGLWLWAAALAILLCLVFLPFSPLVRGLAFLLVLFACVLGLWRTGLPSGEPLSDGGFDGLPPDSYRLPVVLVCGDGLAVLFGADTLHQSAQGCWLRVDEASRLRQCAQQLLWQRPAWGSQLAVMVSVNPQQQGDEQALATLLYELRWQLAQLRRDTRCSLPLLLCSTVATSLARTPVWLAQQATQALTLWPTVTLPETLAQWQGQGNGPEKAERMKQSILFRHHHAWLVAQVLPALQAHHDDVAGVSPQQVLLHQVSGLPDLVSGSLWQQWLVNHTALTQVAGWHPQPEEERDIFLLPDFIFADLPLGNGVSSRQRGLQQAFNLLTVALVVALCSSAWQNRQLLQRIAFDIHQYRSIAMTDYAPKAQAVGVLRQDVALLDEIFRNGEPLRLGLGLYQGERLRAPLIAAIKSYVPPPTIATPMVVTTPQAPQTLRLDSLSLFDTGKAMLKPGSAQVLENALRNIKAKPGWLIVIAGHTDSTGNVQTNQQLSLKRAEAVRDWLVQTGDMPPTCFAVQGLGASHPVATNETEVGRAANRRVEISLLPQADACQAAGQLSASPTGDGAVTSKMEK